MSRFLIRLKRLLKRFLKVKAETRQTPASRTSSKIYKYLMLLMAAVLIAFLYPAENLFQPLDFPRRGEIAQKDIIAPFTITIEKTPEELKEEKDATANAIPTLVEYNTDLVDSTLARFDGLMKRADAATKKIKNIWEENNQTEARADEYTDSLSSSLNRDYPFIRNDAINKLLRSRDTKRAGTVIGDILENEIYFTGVMADLKTLPDVKNRSVVIRIDKREIFIIRDKLLDLPRAYVSFLAALNNRSLVDSFDVDQYYELGRHFIIPNLTVNLDEMEARRNEVMAEISPVSEIIAVGDVIVRAGSKVTVRQANILKEMYRQKEKLNENENWLEMYVPVLARLLLVLAAFGLLYIYLYYYHNQIYASNPKILALYLIYGLELILVYFIGIRLDLSFYLYPVAIFSILITVLFDAEVGTFNTFVLALLLGILHRFNFSITLTTIIVGVVACYSIQRVRQRSEFFKAVLYLLFTYSVLVFVLESFNISPSEDIFNLLAFGWVNAIMSPLLAMGILPFLESLFGFTTNVTLLELSDMNNPLLKRLALEAPGTYHHSILVGNLAEAAAKEIDANPLLARVGAYYHDIGKIEIPEYFVENQLGIKSKHESLTPTMSAIILASHIKKGRILGEMADLPDEVLNFIEEHHGTMTMSYFLNKAKEMGIENPPVEEFKYPGPKPQIRETAIVMLADSVEAASRTLSDPKPARIRNLVQNIINDRFQSGELEECPLTLKDLAGIRESFTKILMGVFHHRIEYPDKEDSK
nr:HDIG domain-containing protein [candidate division Zixibacteria bacterium]